MKLLLISIGQDALILLLELNEMTAVAVAWLLVTRTSQAYRVIHKYRPISTLADETLSSFAREIYADVTRDSLQPALFA